MADELPPLQPQPDSSAISPELMNQFQHSAQWAGTFGGGDTNIAERARHNSDITDYADVLAQTRMQAQQQLIQTNQTAQNLYFNSLKLDLQQKEAQQKMANAAQLLPKTLELRQAQIDADHARAVAATNADLLKAKHDQINAADTLGLSQHMGEILNNSKPGDQDYADGVTRGIIEFPNADKGLQSALLKNAGINTTPEEFISTAMKAKQDALASGYVNPRISEFHGKPVIIEGAAQKIPDANARLQHLESLRMKPNLDEEVKAYLNEEIRKVSQPQAGNTATTTAPPASLDTPEDFTTAFKAAPSGTVLHYKGKPYKKP